MRLLLALLLATLAGAAERPNLVLIFVDDLGYGDLGCYGNQRIPTPHLDQLAGEGQRWKQFYASGSTCVPSRTGLMSGRHPDMLGQRPLTTTRGRMMPALLREAGYATAIFGKWHLARRASGPFAHNPMHPLECGFDIHLGTPGSNDVPAPEGRIQNRELFDECGPTTFPVPLFKGHERVQFPVDQRFLTRGYTENAVQWIEGVKDRPFFVYLAHNMPHAPVFPSPEFKGKSGAGPYGDTVMELDWSVGRIVETLERLKLERKTLLVFTSDNGPWSVFGTDHAGTAKPLRGEKGTSWEGGYRVPAIFHWPGRIAPAEVDALGANLDLLATFAALAGAETPDELPGYRSLDLGPVLFEGKPSPRRQWLYTDGPLAFRSGKWKIHLGTRDILSDPDTRKGAPIEKHDPPLLFDLEADPSETTDLAARHPEVVARLLREMEAFRGE